jgi:hypothetical protein
VEWCRCCHDRVSRPLGQVLLRHSCSTSVSAPFISLTFRVGYWLLSGDQRDRPESAPGRLRAGCGPVVAACDTRVTSAEETSRR